jgi:tetratricopeptide (TPR) repeat protein
MNRAVVMGTWRSMIALDDRVESTGPERIHAAQEYLAELSGIRDEDQLRGLLAQDGSRERNDDLSLLMLVEAARNALEARSSQEAQNLLEWLFFVCPYGTQHHTFEAHGKLLQGILYSLDGQFSNARQALDEAKQLYGDLAGDFGGPESICEYCLGVILCDSGDFDAARPRLEAARKAADAAGSAMDWMPEIEREIQSGAALQPLVTKLSSACSLADVRQVAEHAAGSDGGRILTILRALALAAGADRRPADAVRLARAADWLGPLLGETVQARRDLAEIAMHQLEYPLAEALYGSLLEESPDDTELRARLGRALAEQGRNGEAKEQLTRVLEEAPNYAPALRDLGGVCTNLGDFAEARRYLEAAVAADPSDPVSATVLKQLASRSAAPSISYDPASKEIRISEDLLTRSPEEVAMMMVVAILRANPEGATELLQSIAEEKGADYAMRIAEMAFPREAAREESHYEKAEQFFAARRIAEALAEYKLAIAESRDDPRSYMGAGDCHYHMGRFNLAAAFFEESVAIRPHPSTLRFLGDAHRKAGRMRQAVSAYEQAVQLDPSYAPAREQLRLIQEQAGGRHA